AIAKAGRKAFTIRRADRDFKYGDLVLKREWDPGLKAYTGEALGPVPITCITTGYGLLDGYVVLGLGYGLPTFTPQLLNLQAEAHRLRADALRWGRFVTALAEALGVPEVEGFGTASGYAEDHLLAAARQLVALTGPEARGRLVKALDLTREARDLVLLGHAPKAKEAMGEAAVALLQLVEGRA
ncbi:DUF3850 domain-containing protein, partial [bacterium]|nr:DUF3850 domain-containing protein [bacterium]